MEFIKSYVDILASVTNQTLSIKKACKEVKDSDNWKNLLKMILLLGNALNAARGLASGVKLSSLLTLSGTKANDGSNILGYLIENLQSANSKILDVSIFVYFFLHPRTEYRFRVIRWIKICQA
jgi:hypothetical protein